MSSFFNQPAATPTPAPNGVSTREDFAPATGATPSPGTSGPVTGKAQGAGQAPQYTNLQQFLSGQSQDQVDSETNQLTDKSAKLSQTTTNAANAATSQAKSDTAAGVDAGGVFGNPAASGGTATPAPTSGSSPTGVSALFSAAGNKVSDTGVTVTASAGDPSYDFSKVNLAGYQGPSVTDVGGAFGQAQSASAAAQANATQLASGTPTYNAYDNAVMTSNPGAWGKLQASLTGENQAVADAGAQQRGAQQGVTQAQLASGNSVTQQKSDLGAISGSAASTAATAATAAMNLATSLSSADPKQVSSALADPSLARVGLDSAYAQQLQSGLANGTLSPQQVQTALAPYVAALKSSSGYSAAGASNFNQANHLLGTGQTASGPAGLVARSSTLEDPKAAAATNNTDIVTAKDALAKSNASTEAGTNNPGAFNAGKYQNEGDAKQQNQRAGAAIKDLLSKGYTPEQLASMLGIPATRVNQLSNDAKYSLGNSNVGSAIQQAGKK